MSPIDTRDHALGKAIRDATRASAQELFSRHASEKFYYFALITTGEGHAPFVSAWSYEALERVAANEEERVLMRWSYADSPYCFFGEDYFVQVRELFDGRGARDDAAEFDARINAMVFALGALNDEGIFGTGAERNGIVVNVEVNPPDASNTDRALMLNPRKALDRWLIEAAEP